MAHKCNTHNYIRGTHTDIYICVCMCMCVCAVYLPVICMWV